jgi:hypothetical protein
MKKNIDIKKNVFNKEQYKNVIDTSFTQLISSQEVNIENVPTIEEFFILYDELFFDIPKTGNNSHESLIKKSTEYIDFNPDNELLDALFEEINQLREENLEINKRLIELTK